MTRRELHELLGSRWALAVLSALAPVSGSTAWIGFRFGDLKRAIPGVSSRMLIATLRATSSAELVGISVERGAKLYHLTSLGVAVLAWSGRLSEHGTVSP